MKNEERIMKSRTDRSNSNAGHPILYNTMEYYNVNNFQALNSGIM